MPQPKEKLFCELKGEVIVQLVEKYMACEMCTSFVKYNNKTVFMSDKQKVFL
jgi:hypothetical protein